MYNTNSEFSPVLKAFEQLKVMKITPSVVIDAPGYYVNHFNGRYDIDKCTILRDLQLESDSEAMSASLKHMTQPTHILDMTNNELVMIPDLHARKDIHTLLLARNQISYLDGKVLPPSVSNLVLASNNIASLEQLNGLAGSPKSLTTVVLRGNQVCHLQGYRECVLRLLPQLEVLDFEPVSGKEREQILPLDRKAIDEQHPPEASKGAPRDKSLEIMNLVVSKMPQEKKEELQRQLANASSLAEIARIEKLLSGGI